FASESISLKIGSWGRVQGQDVVRRLDRSRDVARLVARALLLFCCVAVLSGGAFAEEPANRTAIVIFGDSQAAGLARGMQRGLIEDQRYRVFNRTHAGAALVHPENEWFSAVQNFAANEKADIAVAMFGANDRLDLKDASGNNLHFRTDPWREAYAARI